MPRSAKFVAVIAAAATAAAVFLGVSNIRLQERADGLQRQIALLKEQGADAGEAARKEIADAAKARDEADARARAAAQAASPAPFAVEKVEYAGKDSLRVQFSLRPDMDVVRQYVSVEPLEAGALSMRYTTPHGDHPATDGYLPILTITGDFAFGTNVTLRIRKGFPAHGGADAPALAEDFVYRFQRAPLDPHVDFADSGRYLPATESPEISLKCVNVPAVEVAVRRVPAANIVQMLALEEGEYSRIWKSWSASASQREEFVRDISGEPVVSVLGAEGAPNKPASVRCKIPPIPDPAEDAPRAGAARGIYLVRAAIAGKDRDDGGWYGESGANPYRFRVVCVSDLALSVRRLDDGGALLVWLNSFTSGKCVEGAEILVYSSANVLVAKGRTDADGLCRPDRIAPGEPFAVVARAPGGADATFLALRNSCFVDETYPVASREPYVKPDASSAFVWTERGIYRHGEKIFLGALLRNGRGVAGRPQPVVVELLNPLGDLYAKKTLVTSAEGALSCEEFSVPADQPGGKWSFRVLMPGDSGVRLGGATVKIEEFAPPQIRVKADDAGASLPGYSFTASAEHLFGGPAKDLVCEGAVVFEDALFAPAAWKGYRFGNDDRGLKPSFRRLAKARLDDAGRHVFAAPLFADSGLPKAAVRATGQATVFEDGGRAASTRVSSILHYYPYYIGTTLAEWMEKPAIGFPQIDVACVMPDGRRATEQKRLFARIEKIETSYSMRENDDGWATWDSERIRQIVADQIPVPALPDGDTVLTLPVSEPGDYVLTIADIASEVSFAGQFYLSAHGAGEGVTARLSRPGEVSISCDKPFYRVGEAPRLVVRSPFAGNALVTIARDSLIWREVVALTNATAELELPAAARAWAPNVDVAVSVVQAVKPGDGRFAVRAHGQTIVSVRPEDAEIPLALDATVSTGAADGAAVDVAISAQLPQGARDDAFVTVCVVDEGINLLTGEKRPDPIGFFATPRMASHPLFDLYDRLLPVYEDPALKASGMKTGGGFGAELLSRVSPQPTRRFKPLALWTADIPLDAQGKARARFALGEFVGEIRVTAVAWTKAAAGAAAIHRKVAPKLVAQPDAPRFAAPGDVFSVSMPLSNRSGAPMRAAYSLALSGPVEFAKDGGAPNGAMELADGETKIAVFRLAAKGVGEATLAFTATGAGEVHEKEIHLPVRPAMPWRESSGVEMLAPGKSISFPAPAPGETVRRSFSVSGSRLGELASALEWLAEYPHGCLEQTTSRIFPLVASGGILAATRENAAATNLSAYVAAGVRRVESMIRATDFVMWPDCTSAPWDREVSLYAAHFLVEAANAGANFNPAARRRVLRFLSSWALSTNATVSAYACHTLALAGELRRDRMLALYDARAKMDALSRSRLARAFIAGGDRARARELLASAGAPQSLKEAAFALLALLELDAEDPRIPRLALYLTSLRDKTTYSWGTTDTNAHALLALGAYYRRFAPPSGESDKLEVARHDNADGSVTFVNTGAATAFICWRKAELPETAELAAASSAVALQKRLLDKDGNALAPERRLECGDLVYVELEFVSKETRTYSDLVFEDLLPAALEPVRGTLEEDAARASAQWVMRSDVRDDRVFVFSKLFKAIAGEKFVFRYPARVVTPGEFILPAATVEAMYAPEIRANAASARISAR